MRKSFTVNNLPPEERPRERLAALGPEALSINELIAIILSRGISGESVMTTSQNLLANFGSLQGLKDASLQDIQAIKGIGMAKACQIKAAFELARRLENHQLPTPKLNQKSISSKNIYKLVKNQIGNFAKEHFIAISLDTRSKILAVDTIHIGTLTASLVHPRETFNIAIRNHAAAIIVAHNHPSGDPEPSSEDLKITKLLFEAGQILGITMLDHLILGKNTHFSFRENKIM